MIKIKHTNYKNIQCDFCTNQMGDIYEISSSENNKDIEIDLCEKCLLQLSGLIGIMIENNTMEHMIKLGLIEHGI